MNDVRPVIAGIIFAVLTLSGPVKSTAQSIEYPIHVPASWKMEDRVHQEFAQWSNGASTYKANTTATTQTASDIFFTIDNRRTVEASTIDTHHDHLTRCGTDLDFTTATATSGDINEELAYVNNAIWYSISYKRPAGIPDTGIERILRVTCPSQIAAASAPAGWTDNSRGVSVSWIEPNFFSGGSTSQRITLTSHDMAEASPPPADTLHQFIERRTSMTTSCGLPLRISEGTQNLGVGGAYAAIIAESQYGDHRYTAAYLHFAGYDDSAARAALLTLCAKTPFPLDRAAVSKQPVSLPAAEPRVSLSVRQPRSFLMKSVTQYPGTEPPKTFESTQTYSDANGVHNTRGGNWMTPGEDIEIGMARYYTEDGKWIKRKRDFRQVGGNYPDANDWRGTLTQGPDESIDGTPVNVYHIAGSKTISLWVGVTDRYIRHYETRGILPSLGGEYDNRTDFTRFDEPLDIQPPHDFIDAMNCPTGILPPLPLNAVRAVYAANEPRPNKPLDIVVTVYIDTHGHVIDALPAKTSGYPALDRAAVTAARATTFTPGSEYCTPHVARGTYLVTIDPP